MAQGETPRSAVRALLIGVDTFDHPADFPPIENGKAARGVKKLRAVLSRPLTGVLYDSKVRSLINPASQHVVTEAVKRAQRQRCALLICYYVGHGYVDPASDTLYLAVRDSTRRTITSSGVSIAALVSDLENSQAERVVLILDCCHSGGAPGAGHPDSKPFSIITSSPKKMLIHAGEPEDRLTPFTRRLAQVLDEGVPDDGYVTVEALGERLKELAAEDEKRYAPYPWSAHQWSYESGGSTVLSRARRESSEAGEPWRERLRRWGRQSGDWLAERGHWAFGRDQPAWPNRVVGLGLSVALVGGLLTVAISGTRGGSCPPPLELRMATAPEEVEAMTELVETYERSDSNHRDVGRAEQCRSSRITVYGAGLDGLVDAFTRAGEWGSGKSGALATVGPQPDLWAAQSSAEVTYVKGALSSEHSEIIRSSSPMATDRPVLVLTENARKRLGLPTATDQNGLTWKQVRRALGRPAARGMRLLRPNPTVSGVGLVHMLGMHSASKHASTFDADRSPLPSGEIEDLETGVIALGRSVADGGQALCELRTAAHAERPGGTGAEQVVGALVSHRQVAPLRAGQPLGAGCPGISRVLAGEEALTYTLRDVPALDYPLVTVDWPRAADQVRRDGAIAAFQDWLRAAEGGEALDDLGYGQRGGPTVDVGSTALTEWLDRFRVAHPDLRLTVLFDVSGSMRELGRFTTARDAVEEVLGRLGDDDRYTLHTFPTKRTGEGSRWLVGEPRSYEPVEGLPGLSVDDLRSVDERYTDLLGALRTATDALPDRDQKHQHAVLLITDGEYLPGREVRLPALKEVARQLRKRHIPVLVASMRPYGCGVGHEPYEVATASGGECAPLSGELSARLARAAAALTEGRRL